jgi:hypothetical protein
MEWAGGLERLLEVLGVCAAPAGLRPGGEVDRGHHVLPTTLSILVSLVMVVLGRGGVIVVVSTTEVASGLGLAAEVGLDNLLAGGVLGGDIQEFSHHAWGVMAERVDECLVGCATDEDVDHIGIDDVGKLIVLFGEALDVLPEGLVGPLLAVTEVP